MESPLHVLHKELNATFTTFMGYEMPLKYTSIRDEHLNVRRKIGVFDVSHMGNLFVRGNEAEQCISKVTVTDIRQVDTGMGGYTVILKEDGTIIDDEVFLHLEDGYLFIPNAGKSEHIESWFKEKAHAMDVEIENVSQSFTIIAVQGPSSKECLQKIIKVDLDALGLFACRELRKEEMKINVDARCIVSRTGYTGERGYEFYISPGEEGAKLFKKVLEAGEEYGIKPIGLGARDTLRLEKCFALAGNEFEGGRTPLEAGLQWLINWEHDFIGKEALLRQKKSDYEKLSFLKCIDAGIPRHGNTVEKNGENVGQVTSGTFSPCLKKGIAMAYVKSKYRDVGNILGIVVNKKIIKAEVIKPPFVKKGTC